MEGECGTVEVRLTSVTVEGECGTVKVRPTSVAQWRGSVAEWRLGLPV